MDKINVEKLTPEIAINLTKSPDFNNLFSSLSPDEKRVFLSKIKNKRKNTVIIPQSETTNIPPKKKVTTVEASIPQQAKSLTKAAVDWAKSGFKMAPGDVYADRMVICRNCEFWKEISGPVIGRCMKCGCTGAKQKLATSKCPIGKWGQYKN